MIKLISDYKDKNEYILYNLKYGNIDENESIENYQKKYNNKEIIGMIKIDNTSINNLIVKHADNNYYLNHDYSNKQTKLGSIFLDSRNKLTDKKLIIYGHNFKNQIGLFSDLVNYDKEDFYKKNNIIKLSINNLEMFYKVFSVFIVTKKSNNFDFLNLSFNTQMDYYKHINDLKNNSIYKNDIELKETDEILVLQTCYYDVKNSFIVVVSRKEN